jgi:predicted phosphodiesterase
VKLTPERAALALREGMTKTELAARYNATRKEIDRLLGEIKTPAEFDVLHFGTPLELSGDFIIVGDVHVPATDWQFSRLVGKVADKTNIRRLIIAGDFFNFDFASYYKVAAPPATWHQERDAGRILIHDWLETFTEIYVLQGNHDRRMTNWTAAELDEADAWGMINTSSKIKVTKYSWCQVNSAGVPWRVTHPKSYGRNQLTVASDLANKHACNVIGWHEHHAGIGWDVYGRYVVVNGGSLVDVNKLAYAHLDDSRIAGMKQGFVVLKGGCAKVLSRYPFTEWDEWLG